MNIPSMTAPIISIGKAVRASYSPPEKPKHTGVKISAGSKLLPPKPPGLTFPLERFTLNVPLRRNGPDRMPEKEE
jgi:hypothetical protein